MTTDLQSRFQSVLTRAQSAWAERGKASPLPHPLCLIAVSKSQSVDAVEELYRAGHRDFGENYVQELEEKARVLEERGCSGIRWHFIGHLQTNKAKTVVDYASVVHSVDSERLAQELTKRREAKGIGILDVFLEVNIDDEPSKTGLKPPETKVMAQRFRGYHGLRLLGLMCIPAAASQDREITQSFRRLRQLEESCHPHTVGCLSMGMSQDFELAILNGATHVRVGTGIFGERTPKK